MPLPSIPSLGPIVDLIPDVSTVLVPYTAGGDTLPSDRVGPLGADHYAQRDTSLNHAVWSLFPVNDEFSVKNIDRLGEHITPPHKDGGYGPTFARNLLTQTVSIHERGRIIANLHTLNLIFSGLVSGSHYFPPTVDGELLSFWSVIRDRKHANLAEPVLDLVERLTRRKDSTNQVSFQSAHYAAAMIDYCLILCDLYPWTATPLLFTSKDAFELGVAQLEASLWSNMSVTALHLAKSTGDNGWLHIAQGTAAAVYNMRFATSKLLARAYWPHVQGRQHAPHQAGFRVSRVKRVIAQYAHPLRRAKQVGSRKVLRQAHLLVIQVLHPSLRAVRNGVSGAFANNNQDA
ncbi:uncharacterized protein EHS24_009627 [Apiotrichum porosum]|uniref:Uncharacterized protein n=1 Tax=Apiotrichum porosum TaxID=105984 RepID=A0A427XM66_9TREE|nr:uncharacterized protein EHS24_009627 [Apiotrichum porosum]RSH79956.1 hypothetical protein EHS24_009627 [Apiotrichum porosum]